MRASVKSEGLVWLGQPAANKREAILASAQQIFAASGFHGAEVQAIADSTGISKATIYKYFGSKDKLLLDMVREVLNHLGVLSLKAVVSPEPAMARLLAIAESFLRFGEENRDLCLLILRDGGGSVTEIAQSYGQKMDQFLPIIEPIFEAARQDGSLGNVPTRVIVDTVLSCLLGHFQSWFLLYNCEGSLLEKGMTSVRFLVDGFQKAG